MKYLQESNCSKPWDSEVVDMFGAGLPVCARSFAALPEPVLNLSDFKIVKDSFDGCVLRLRLVQHGENGFVFSSSEDRNSSFDGDCINHQV